jgi:hypothetical protein
MKMDNKESLAIKTVYRSGRSHYKKESYPSRGQVFGSALYRSINNPAEAIEIAATICEENNWHEYAKKLREIGNPF